MYARHRIRRRGGAITGQYQTLWLILLFHSLGFPTRRLQKIMTYHHLKISSNAPIVMVAISLCCLFCLPATATERDPVPSLDMRFAQTAENAVNEDESPDFRRHVVPLMGRLGCNGRACHGSFQGQGDFRLSLFGYDFKADHENLLQGEEPRVNIDNLEASLFLQKPLANL